MNYVIFDLEFNQGYDSESNTPRSNEKCPFEILQIGAIKLGCNLGLKATFNRYIKPSIYKELNPFVVKITNIEYKDLRGSKKYPIVFYSFLEFCSKDDDTVLLTWGRDDIHHLVKNNEYHGIKLKKKIKYLDAQRLATVFFRTETKNSIGLKNSIEIMGITDSSNLHNAFFDAYYSSIVFKFINLFLADKTKKEYEVQVFYSEKYSVKSPYFYNEYYIEKGATINSNICIDDFIEEIEV